MANSWTVFFMYKPFTSIHTTLLTKSDDVEHDILIKLAVEKIKEQTGIDVYELRNKLGENDNFGTGWLMVEDNAGATDEELASIDIIHEI